ncbi:hypothetical protein PHACT_12310 [Pseudohongiella acticola]|uniref:Uncharacterized protein n=1 Tax=Pseudohongiella acticola TaxID=1524254 RepID=A0A1E8CGL1_9GAMM|nr:hypothetical protein [Pseudohongiella acticola]OFE11337.1 hypothetical protein PHACT_12310 [Pseudohongiella acticola]
MTYLKNYVAATMLLGCSHAVWAEQSPVVLRDDVLTLPQAVVMDGDDFSHFRNVELTQGANGNFAITASDPGNLAQVESVEILKNADRVDVLAEGFRSACVSIEPAAVSYHDGQFMVAIPVSEPTSDVCIELAVEYYLITTLPTEDLSSGEYSVNVNGVKTDFTL